MQSLLLEEFSINALNGESNVNLKFIDNKKILVSENGNGKTTIISIFYYFLRKDNKVRKFDFESLCLKFEGKDKIVYNKEVISLLFGDDFISAFDYVANSININKISGFFNSSLKKNIPNSLFITLIIYFLVCEENSAKINGLEIKDITERLEVVDGAIDKLIKTIKKHVSNYDFFYTSDKLKVDFMGLYKGVNAICNEVYVGNEESVDVSPFSKRVNFLIKSIDELSYKEFIYLPTYRLVESNISSFRKDENEEYIFDNSDEAREFFKDNPHIQFGVEDIKETWDKLTNKIRKSTTQDFQKLSGILLKNILSNKKFGKKNINELLKNKDSIIKILSRIDQDTIDDRDKKNLLSIIEKKDISSENNNSLFYILENMVFIYNNQKDIDETINKYKNVVNGFLNNKKVIFDEITSEIYVEKLVGHKRIDIEKLSSGEKQILSLFTKIYLSDIDNAHKKYWIFYDEPEISLSIEWQKLLLPKIIESGKCEFLLAATHSPFIFKNDLKFYTSDLSLEVTELNS